ncbi:MAG: ABC transporter substrate-binding protein [Brevinematales bacterium]
MKRLSILMAIVFAFSCSKQEVIKIGFMGPMTGGAANYGKLMSQAVKMAVEEKNAEGGIGGKKIQLIIEDDEGKPEKATPAIEKLAGVDKVFGIVGPVFSGCALAIAPKCQAEKVVMITPSSTHKALTSMGNYIFRNVLSDELQAKVFARYAYEKMGLRKVAILYLKNDYSQGLAEDFKSEFEKLGGKIVAFESALQDDKDFKTQLTKIKNANPEALYMPDYVAEMAQIIEQSKQLGLKVKFLAGDGYSNPEIFDLIGDLANGVIFANSAEEADSPVKKAFIENYEKKWGVKPDSFSMNAYDSAKILIAAIEKVYNESSDEVKKNLKLDRDKIREYVAATENYDGASGVVTFMKEKGDAIKNVGIFIAENKQYKQLKVFTIKDDKLIEIK